jgi:hypothetical protein
MQDIVGEPIGGRMAQRRDGARHEADANSYLTCKGILQF